MTPLQLLAGQYTRITRLLQSQGVGGVLVRATGGSMGAKLAAAGVGIVLHVTLARTMGPEQYGVYVFAMTILNLLLIPCVLGLDTAIVRFASAYASSATWDVLRGLWRRSDQIVIGMSLIVVALFVACLHLFGGSMSPDMRSTLLVGSAIVPLLALITIRQASLRGLKRVVFSRLPEPVVRPAILVVLVAGVLLSGRALAGIDVMRLNIIAAAGALVASVIFFRRSRPPEVSRSPAAYHTKEWVHVAVPLLFVSSIFILLGRVDRLMVGIIRGPTEVGFYGIANRISTLVLFGLQGVNTIAAPMISEYYASKSRAELQQLVTRIAKLIFWITMPVLAFVVLFGRFILGVFGPEFETAYPALLFLSAGVAVNASTGPVGFLLTMTGHERTSLRIVSLCLVLNIVFNVPAIYYFGAAGAAAATGFTVALRNLLTWRVARARVGVDASVWGLVGAKPGAAA